MHDIEILPHGTHRTAPFTQLVGASEEFNAAIRSLHALRDFSHADEARIQEMRSIVEDPRDWEEYVQPYHRAYPDFIFMKHDAERAFAETAPTAAAVELKLFSDLAYELELPTAAITLEINGDTTQILHHLPLSSPHRILKEQTPTDDFINCLRNMPLLIPRFAACVVGSLWLGVNTQPSDYCTGTSTGTQLALILSSRADSALPITWQREVLEKSNHAESAIPAVRAAFTAIAAMPAAYIRAQAERLQSASPTIMAVAEDLIARQAQMPALAAQLLPQAYQTAFPP